LHCHSNYSFLEGASHPEDLVARARELEIPALAITDRNGLYGAVKFVRAAQAAGIKPIVGVELTLDDGTPPPKDRVDFDRWGDRIVVLAEDRAGYTQLCRVISRAQMPHAKGTARLDPQDLASIDGHCFALVARPRERLPFYQEIFGRDRVFLDLHDHLAPGDRARNQELLELATAHGAPIVITNEVFYATRDRHRLHDVLTAIRHRTTLEGAHRYLHPNADFALKSERELREVFARYPQAVVAEGFENAAAIAQQCDFRFDLKGARFPGFPVPAGETPFSFLYRLCQEAAREKYRPVTPEVAARLQKELGVIDRTGFAEFFLINWDLMRFARSRGIPGQGRGSAADSIVAYLLGITRVDPIAHNLLFERFLHEEMTTTPDIDIDFSTAHREQVIQYIFEKYGPECTGMVCNVVTYRQRSAIREVGKALGFKEDTLDRLAKSASAWHPESPETIAQAAGYATGAPGRPWRELFDLATQILEFPRHLSIHVGGMLVTGQPLIDIVPVERATMPGRMVIQFNKDDVEELGLIKMDMLGLRMLSVVAEALDLIEADTGVRPDLDALDLRDEQVYALCQQADTIGVFQIESRAQMQTLPRSRPDTFNDLVVEVAIIRPGPIQGDAVHPYLRRKQRREPVTYLHPRLEPILKETLGVVLYQEQILKISMECAGFSGGEADRFRRAMSSRRGHAQMEAIRERFLAGCAANQIAVPVAEEIFSKLAAFAEFGFTKSHAAAFARTCYETAWLKLHHAPALYAGLLNNQPMGFYHPHVLVEDAKRHGVRILPLDINRSYTRCTVESGALRLGFNYVHGLGEKALEVLEEAQMKGAIVSVEDFCHRIRLTSQSRRGLTRAQVQTMILAGAFDALEPNRREAVWRFNEQVDDWQRAPLLAEPALPVSLAPMTHRETVATDYRLLSLTTTDHLIHFYRPQFAQLRVIDSKTLRESVPDGARVRVGGLVITRQSPSTGKEFKFFTLADEFGHVDVILRPPIYQRYRQVANLEPILIMDGQVQKQDGVMSVLVTHIEAAPALPAEDTIPQSRNYR
ncbi:MAG TPA: error-prone DNA polymerase, partial [Candidatus Limnocylindrales bacterium]|nr:error-prone DNA polymerase [Candidatus Limnocylindrales bacterium]